MLPGSRRVTLVKDLGGPGESRQQVSGNIQPAKGFFGLETPIDVGDVIEAPDPRAGSTEPLRYWVAKVDIHDVGRHGHIEVTWGSQPAAAAPCREVSLDLAGLHEATAAAAAPLYHDGHYAPAVFQAFKAVEIRLRELSGLDLSGRDLAAQALGSDPPRVAVSRHAVAQAQTSRKASSSCSWAPYRDCVTLAAMNSTHSTSRRRWSNWRSRAY